MDDPQEISSDPMLVGCVMFILGIVVGIILMLMFTQPQVLMG